MGKDMNIDAQLSELFLLANSFFSDAELKKYMEINYDTYKTRKRRKRFPLADAEKYLAAFEKCSKMPRKRNEKERFSEKTWRKDVDLTLKRLRIALDENKYFNSFLETVCTLIYRDKNAADKFSKSFSYRINMSFPAFSLIESNDLSFLRYFFTEDAKRKYQIREMLNQSECNKPNDVLPKLESKEGQCWFNARKIYSPDINIKASDSVYQNWSCFRDNVDKLKEEAYVTVQEGKYQKLMQLVYLSIFIALIWPKDGADDTTFGTEEIDALIIFKYFLTENARQSLLAQLKDLK